MPRCWSVFFFFLPSMLEVLNLTLSPTTHSKLTFPALFLSVFSAAGLVMEEEFPRGKGVVLTLLCFPWLLSSGKEFKQARAGIAWLLGSSHHRICSGMTVKGNAACPVLIAPISWAVTITCFCALCSLLLLYIPWAVGPLGFVLMEYLELCMQLRWQGRWPACCSDVAFFFYHIRHTQCRFKEEIMKSSRQPPQSIKANLGCIWEPDRLGVYSSSSQLKSRISKRTKEPNHLYSSHVRGRRWMFPLRNLPTAHPLEARTPHLPSDTPAVEATAERDFCRSTGLVVMDVHASEDSKRSRWGKERHLSSVPAA